MSTLADMRKNYDRDSLDESQAHPDPFAQFQDWFKHALESNIAEPNAMTLATVGADGRPSTRVVLIKEQDARGLVWFTNYGSRKGRELAHSPYAALQFHWVELERVVRIEGKVEKIDPAESDAYFQSRPLDSRIGAWASPQSQEIEGRNQLIKAATAYAAKFLLNPPRPDHWGGYRLVPDRWEFWQGRKSRLHDRLCYCLQPNGQWQRMRLAP
jgi:pyridoxamine 5'-phosphate oxidase